MFGGSRRTVLLVLFLASGCHTWRRVPLAPGDTGSLPAHSRVVRMGGEAVEIRGGRVSPDSLVGAGRNYRLAIPRDSVAFVEERRFSAGRTLGVAAGVLAVSFSAMLLAAFAITSGY
jgi:hypothetical protein